MFPSSGLLYGPYIFQNYELLDFVPMLTEQYNVDCDHARSLKALVLY